MEPLIQKDVPEEIMLKVLRFAEKHDTFTTKQLFETYPNNQEFLLRYAVQNLRIEEKVFKFGNKRGAYYSMNPNIGPEKDDNQGEVTSGNSYANREVKQIILEEAKKRNGNYFKRSDLGLESKYPIHVIIASVKQLVEEKELEVQGIRRWTEYRYSKGENKSEKTPQQEKKNNSNFENEILNYIIVTKVVTIPMLIEKFNTQRYNIIPALDSLVEKEEIYHEGNKRSSKYIYKDVPCDQVDKIIDQLTEERKITQTIDALSEFLFSDEFTSIGIGFNRNDKFEIKFISNGQIVKKTMFDTIEDGFSGIKELIKIKD